MTPEEQAEFNELKSTVDKMRGVVNAHSGTLKKMSEVINRQNRRIQLLETGLERLCKIENKDALMQNILRGLRNNGG